MEREHVFREVIKGRPTKNWLRYRVASRVFATLDRQADKYGDIEKNHED